MTITSQAFRNALHVPVIDPVAGNVVQVQSPAGDAYPTAWANASGLPDAPNDGFTYGRRNAAWIEVLDATSASGALAGKVNVGDYDDLDVLAKIKNVDGAGSGLDADLLDGQQGAYYTGYADGLFSAGIDAGTY